jgi:hypothetical protein
MLWTALRLNKLDKEAGMSVRIQMDQTNSDGYLGYHKDGLADFFVGMGLVLFGLGILTDLPWIGAVMAAVLFPVWQSAKLAITAPRTAHIEDLPSHGQDARRTTLTAIGLGVLVLLGCVTLWLFGANTAPLWVQTALREYFTLFLGAIAAVTFGTIALVGDLGRYYLYLIFVASQVVDAALYLPLIATGGVLLLGGLWYLNRFVRQYPAAS